ncbi:hypothetical protein TNCT_141691 [Trichonephila clavata]|uniref:DUF985 domain-containing protein n=1 Tax=Trichonephila clavata TaxID=2740835 RepID=A0A8X6KCJ1_TRICU|nr:hypothetical protein TNCT_141691 [Trichonephila clavata]
MYTSEQGHFKEFARGVNYEGKSFTCIFYFLRDGEVSYFHKLHNANKPERSPEETWIWLAGRPVSLYTKDINLTQKVINEDNKDTTIPSNTWFAAEVTNGNQNTTKVSKDEFSLVNCHCTPSFTLSSYHDLTENYKLAWESLIDIYQHSTEDGKKNIEKFLLMEEREKFVKASQEVSCQESKQLSLGLFFLTLSLFFFRLGI